MRESDDAAIYLTRHNAIYRRQKKQLKNGALLEWFGCIEE